MNSSEYYRLTFPTGRMADLFCLTSTNNKMNIQEALLAEHSKAQSERIAEYVGNDPVRFAELMESFLSEDQELSRRAAWVLSHCADRHASLIEPHLEAMIRNLRNDVHVAVRRNTVRVLQEVEIPDELLGEAADICFGYLADHHEAIAVKVFAMTVLANICRREPDLGNELKLLIEEQLPYASAGFRSRAKRILAGLDT